jgi:hypothetical protein
MTGLSAVATLWLAAVFAYAVALKVVDLRGAIGSLQQQAVLARRMVPFGLAALVLAEGAATLLLIPTQSRPIGATGAAILGMVFAFYAWVIRGRRVKVPCGCAAGLSSEPIDGSVIVRGALIAAAGVLVAATSPAIDPVAVAVAAALGAVPGTLLLWRRATAARSRRRDREHRHSTALLIEPARQDLVELLSRPSVGSAGQVAEIPG